MSVEPSTIDDGGYCDPSDVRRLFDRFGKFDDTTPYNQQEVKELIAAKSDKIDRYTGHAWRERRVVDEFKNLEGVYRWRSGLPLSLQKRDIRDFDASKGDKLEFFDGDGYEDWVASDEYQFDRDGDFWVESSTGMLFVYRRSLVFDRYRELKVTYRYGQDKVPAAINNACAKLVAAEMLEMGFYDYVVPGNEEAPDPATIAERWRESVWERLDDWKEVKSTGIDM